MKTTVKFLSLVIIMTVFSCSNETLLEEPIQNVTFDQSDSSRSSTIKSTVAIIDYTGVEIQGASSTLHRNTRGVKANFKTENLIPGNAYTMWWVVFGETPGPPNVTFADGLVVGQNGKANFKARKMSGLEFTNPLTAEVHLAIRTHGPAIPGMIDLQTQTMDGGCNPDIGYPSGPSLYPDSDIEGYCANVQVAMHIVD